MVSPKMLVAWGCHLGSLKAHVVGDSSNIQIHNIDGLPSGPNASRARTAYTLALCPLQEPVWVHCPGAPRRKWLATRSSFPSWTTIEGMLD